jgi:hypothetical protein
MNRITEKSQLIVGREYLIYDEKWNIAKWMGNPHHDVFTREEGDGTEVWHEWDKSTVWELPNRD